MEIFWYHLTQIIWKMPVKMGERERVSSCFDWGSVVEVIDGKLGGSFWLGPIRVIDIVLKGI